MVHKPIAIMILPVFVAGILMLGILAASGNAQESSNTGNTEENNNHPMCLNEHTEKWEPCVVQNSPQKHESSNTPSSQESSNTGNGATSPTSTQETSNTGTATQGFSNNGNTADFANTILAVHNRERAAVGVPDLVWSNSLAADAKSYADDLMKLNQGKDIDEADLVHSEKSTRPGQAENLSLKMKASSGTVSPPSTESLLQGWVSEKPWRGSFDHYTQMVWKNTKEVGCATATGSGKSSSGLSGVVVYLVCRYSPPGNMVGEKPY
jgi:uncharacterized protein YkwD